MPLIIIVAFLAFLTQSFLSSGALIIPAAPTASNHYLVDLGYQLNVGNTVVVSTNLHRLVPFVVCQQSSLSMPRPNAWHLVKNHPHVFSRTTLLSRSEIYALPPRR